MPPVRPPAKSPVVPSPAARQREAARLLMRLDDMLKATAVLEVKAREQVSVGGLGRYSRFTRKVRDFFALASIAEERIELLPEEMGAPQMATALDRMHARMVLLFVEGSAAFFNAFGKQPHLPLGAHEICGLELRGLLAICAFLDDPRYEGERGQELRRRSERIAQRMRSIMDRASPLPDFGDQPSIGAKGQVKRPLKAPRRPSAPLPPVPDPPEPESEPPVSAPFARSPSTVTPQSEVPEVRQLTLDDFPD